MPLLLEFAELWRRGLADERKLWQLFDVAEMYLQRPDYFGAPVFNTGALLVTPVFSSSERLARFVLESGQVDAASLDDVCDWVRLSGEKFFGLPVRARYLVIDPGSDVSTTVDLRAREGAPSLANGAPPIAIHLELQPDGSVGNGMRPEDLAGEDARATRQEGSR